jgi:hypothetical protein
MPRVVPSLAVAYIDSFPTYATNEQVVSMNMLGSAALSAVLDLVEQIPDELLTMDSESYALFTGAKARIRDILATWTSNRNAGHPLHGTQFHRSQDPLACIRDALAKCPDEFPAPGTSDLNFITDPDLRTNLRKDIGAINLALSNGEWKAATVLAGSTIEAILLWDIRNRRAATYPAAVTALVNNGTFRQQLSNNPDDWVLHNYIEVAAYLGIIKPDTVTEARLAKDFRNLIHPGRLKKYGSD